MSTAAKALIVLNLVLALIFAVGELSLFGKRINWVKQTRLAINEANDIYAKLGTEVNQLKSDIEKNKTELLTLRSQLEATQGDLEIARAALESAARERDLYERELTEKRNEASNDKARLSSADKRNTELQAKLNDEITRKRGLEIERDWHSNRAIESASDLVESENEMMQLAKSNAELVRRVTLLSTQLDNYIRRYGADPEVVSNAVGVAINGRVLRVEPKLDLVILSVGSKDKVQKGMEFVISRDRNYISKVRVANVYDEMCSAKIVDGMTTKGETVRISDSAGTLD